MKTLFYHHMFFSDLKLSYIPEFFLTPKFFTPEILYHLENNFFPSEFWFTCIYGILHHYFFLIFSSWFFPPEFFLTPTAFLFFLPWFSEILFHCKIFSHLKFFLPLHFLLFSFSSVRVLRRIFTYRVVSVLLYKQKDLTASSTTCFIIYSTSPFNLLCFIIPSCILLLTCETPCHLCF